MATTTLKTRIQHKYDTPAKWAEDTSFVPLKGEICVFNNGTGVKPEMKIGDGITTLASLPFLKAGSDITVSRSLTSGTKIATITIDGVATDLYCQTNTDTTYSAGTGLSLSGTTFSQIARNITIGNKTNTYNGTSDLTYSLHDIEYISNIGSNTSWNIYDNGLYYTRPSTDGDTYTGEGNPEAENGGGALYRWGLTEVKRASHGLCQFYYAHHASKGYGIKYRSGWNSYVDTWQTILDTGNYTTYCATAGHTHSYLPLIGGTLTGTLSIMPPSGEGGEMVLQAAANNTTKSGIILDNYYGTFRIYGAPSADGTTITGVGTPLEINPYSKTIQGGYYFDGNAATASFVAWSGITGKPSTFTPSSHTHNNIVSSGIMTMITDTARWANGFTVGDIYDSGYPFPYGTTWMWNGSFGAELIFNGLGGDAGAGTGHMYFRTRSDWATSTWGDWKHLLDSSNYTSYTVKKDGTGASGTWGISISGNASTATKATQDGNGNVISSTYLPLSGGTITGNFQVNGNSTFLNTLRVGSSTSAQYAEINLHRMSADGNHAGILCHYVSGDAIYSGIAHVYDGSVVSDLTFRNGYLQTNYPIRANLEGNAATASSVAWSGITGKPSTFTPSSHSHNVLASQGARPPEMNRTCSYDGVYTYRTTASIDVSNMPTTYTAVIGFGNAVAGAAEIAAEWTDGMGLWFRSLRDYQDDWYSWKRIWVEGNSITGAVWNDYAEFRESTTTKPGLVVFENGDDTLSPTTERLSHFAGVVSDTWGFCQGETERAKTPIAVAGRVLAYTYRNRNEYKPGDCVCAAPDGTIDIMTREEVERYPDRIVGTVSCVPEYEEWGQGDRPAVKVDGRIWIKVR